MSEESFEKDRYEAAINLAAVEWGRAHITDAEFDRLLDARRETEDWEEVARMLFDAQIGSLSELEYDDFIQSAIQHGCPVAYDLLTSGKVNMEDLMWSYLTKNMAYRFVAGALRDTELLEEWKGIERKKENEVGVLDLVRPDSIPADELRGIEKIPCYFTCQLLRVMEGIRLGRENLRDPMFRQNLKLSRDEREMFGIWWDEYWDAIRSSKNMNDIAANVALTAFRELVNRGLDKQKALYVIFEGFRPHGRLFEHGQLENILEVLTLTAYKIGPHCDFDVWEQVHDLMQDAVAQYNERAEQRGTPLLVLYGAE